MYTKSMPEPDGGASQSFRRGGYQIPASYAGNAFQADFSPDETTRAAPESPVPREDIHTEDAALPASAKPSEPPLSGLLSKLGSPSLDDVLLIGLILLLSRERESSTGTLLLLALLLLT